MSNISPKVFYIPNKVDFVVVSDMFVEDYSGGAELTLEAILEKSPGPVFKLHSSLMTPELVEANKNKIWILGNFVHAPKASLIELVASKVRFFIIECDYKYCKWRSSHLHLLQEKQQCDCHLQSQGIFIRALFQRAQKVFFMSAAQLNEYKRLFPQVKSTNFCVLSSVFSGKTLDEITKLRIERKQKNIKNSWAIMSGGSWIKAEKQTIDWCNSKGMEYELIGGLSPNIFLVKLSTMKGLVFRPAGYDTCPRLVIEAKLLGLELELNENVQHSPEAWFNFDIETCENYLRTRPDFFWNEVNSPSLPKN